MKALLFSLLLLIGVIAGAPQAQAAYGRYYGGYARPVYGVRYGGYYPVRSYYYRPAYGYYRPVRAYYGDYGYCAPRVRYYAPRPHFSFFFGF